MREALYPIYFIVYFIISFAFTLQLVFVEKPKNRIINFCFIYWFLTFNFYKSAVMWSTLPQTWHLRKGDFMLAMFLTSIFVLSILSKVKEENKIKLPMPKFEKYLFIYIFFVFFMYGLHYYLGNISYYKATSFSRLYLDALLIYITIRHFVTKELIRMFMKAIIYLAIVSALAAIVQFFIDTKFLRVGHFHFAFPGHNRSSGLFSYPYDSGIFQIIAVYTVAYYFTNWKIKIPLIALFVFALLLDFTRGTWIAFIVVTIFHLYYYYKKAFGRILLILGIASFVITLVVGAYFAQERFFEGDVSGRVTSDTVTVRMAFYAFVLQAIPQKPLTGYGDVENNEVYFKGMVNAEQNLFWALGRSGGIHNLFLEEAFLRGIFAPILLILLFVYFIIFNVKESIRKNNYFYCIPNYFAFGFFLYFNSVSGFLMSRTGFLCIPIFAIVSGIYYKNLDISDILPKRDLLSNMKQNKRLL